MKSLLLARVFPPQVGGSGRWFWETYRRLPRGECVIVAGEAEAATAFDETHELNVVRAPLDFPDYGVLSVSGYKRYRRLYSQTLRTAVAENVEAVHAGSLLPEGWISAMVAKRLRLPLLLYLHGEELCYTNGSRQLDWMARRVLQQTDCVVVNSRNSHALARNHWHVPESKLRVMHPGVNCSRFVPAPRCGDARRRLGWGDRSVVLTVGRLQQRKGQDTMIRALPLIRERLPNVLYAIVGDGALRDDLRELARELDVERNVKFHGEPGDDELLSCYQQCDLFALPNRRIGGDIEGFGIVLLEAQACGKPVIAGNSGGTAETMHQGETGITVDCSGTEELAEQVIALLLDEGRRLEMGRAAREWVVSRFDWESLTREARELFHDLSETGRLACGAVATSAI